MFSLAVDETTFRVVLVVLLLGFIIKIWSGKLNPRTIRSLKPNSSNQSQYSNGHASERFSGVERKEIREQDLRILFPPCRRSFASLACPQLKLSAVDYEKNRVDKPIPIDRPFLDANQDFVSPTGFQVSEILEIGEFPDYAALSGFPLPEPCINFDIETAKARPYRPFRWPYHQTMAISRLEPNYWLEVDKTYSIRLAQRRDLLQEHGADLHQALPGSELALKELSEIVIQFLCARYPTQFSLAKCVDGHVFHNRILRTTTNLAVTNPLDFLAANVPEDFAVMIRDPDTGKYRLRAGIICSAIDWNLGEKMDRPLSEIHEPVPDYAEKMEKSMDKWFARVGTDAPVQRGSWSWERGEMLHWSPKAGPVPGFDECTEEEYGNEEDGKDVHLRVDWQTLRRLPLTGAIVFNFKALFTPLSDLIREPFVPALALKVLTEGKAHILKYKGIYRTERVVKKALQKYAERQVEMGIVPKDWEVSTLDQSPFWQGWQEYYC